MTPVFLSSSSRFFILFSKSLEGLDIHVYLKGWVNGVKFQDEEVIDL